MANIELKHFQEKAINFASSELKRKDVLKLQSPTGSGKTLMTAKIIDKFLKSHTEDFFQKTSVIYISLSSGSLDYQGYQKISHLLDEGFVSGFRTKYVGTNNNSSDIKTKNYIQGITEFKRNTVYFMGWGILSANSKIFKEGEEDNIFNIIRRTKASGTKLLLIIDEAHRDNPMVESMKSVAKDRIEFLKELNPERQLWLSATFTSLKKPISPDYIVRSDEVKAEGVIKQEIEVNPIVNDDWSNESINTKLIRDALAKRREIINSIAKAKIKFNPLILIQIPDGNPKFDGINVNEYYLKIIEKTLESEGLKKEFDYGIYLSEQKTNSKKMIEAMNSPLKVIVFKQAIATGWDVPRANILVKLRKPSTKTDSFEMQTLGRILRNPFLKIYRRGGNLTNEDVKNLNNAFVFTNDIDYSEFIKKEYDFLNDKTPIKKTFYDISKKAKNIPLSLNILTIDEFDSEIWNETIHEVITNNNFIKKILKDSEDFIKNNGSSFSSKIKTFDASSASEGILKMETNSQLEMIVKPGEKKDLYFTYIDFLQAVDGSRYVEKIIKKIVELEECKLNIKEMFEYFTGKYNEIFRDEKTLKEVINEIAFNFINPKITYDVMKTFKLSDTVMFFDEVVSKIPNDFEQDTLINSYLMEIHKSTENYKIVFDSLQEAFFYSWFDSFEWTNEEKKNVHLFRNGINPNDSFFIEYLDVTSMRKRKFFPDFILTTKTKILILEVKGLGKNNIDYNAENKLSSVSLGLDKIKVKKEVVVFKVGSSTTPKSYRDLVCYQYKNGKKQDMIPLTKLKDKIIY